MIAGLTGKEIRDKLDTDDQPARLLAEIVCSTYWGGGSTDLRELAGLNSSNRALADAIMCSRTAPGWNDSEFFALACWCRIRHNLSQWSKEN